MTKGGTRKKSAETNIAGSKSHPWGGIEGRVLKGISAGVGKKRSRTTNSSVTKQYTRRRARIFHAEVKLSQPEMEGNTKKETRPLKKSRLRKPRTIEERRESRASM